MSSPQSMRIYFVRHGEADYNLLDRVNCRPDVRNNLTATGREQALGCAKTIAEARIDVLYSSAFPRALQTAEILNQRFQAPLRIDPLLNETGAFAFEGQPAAQWHAAQVPDRIQARVAGCESYPEMKARLHRFLDGLRAAPHQCCIVVSHEEPIQILAGLIEGIADVQARARPIRHCTPLCYTLAR